MPRLLKNKVAAAGACVLLLAYAAQALYLAAALPMDAEESRTAFGEAKAVWFTVHEGAVQPAAKSTAPTQERASRQVSPLMRGIARAVPWQHLPGNPKIWLRLPMILAGVMLGLSVWIIARRWYGAAGGLMAVAIYSFSTALVQAGARLAPDIVAAWGIYGVVFTAMAIAHACYAAPGTVGRGSVAGKIVMFALALGVGAAAQPSWWFGVALVLALALSIYLLGPRRSLKGGEMVGESRAVWLLLGRLAMALALGVALLLAIYSRHWSELPQAMHRADVTFLLAPSALTLQRWLALVMLALAVIIWLSSRRSRWFGNTAPLIAAIAFALKDSGIFALAFVTLFVAGVFADRVQSRPAWRVPVILLLAVNAAAGVWSVMHF